MIKIIKVKMDLVQKSVRVKEEILAEHKLQAQLIMILNKAEEVEFLLPNNKKTINSTKTPVQEVIIQQSKVQNLDHLAQSNKFII